MIDLESGLDIDKLNFVRRILSVEMNMDFTNSETIENLIVREFVLVRTRNKNDYKDLESKFEKIRRKLSYELDKDLKSSEVVPILLEKAYDSSKIVKEKPVKSYVHLINEELARGLTVAKCAEKYGVSMSTIFRWKSKLREMNY